MDFQNGIVDALLKDGSLLDRVDKASWHAREKSMPVIYVSVRLPAGQSVSDNNKIFSAYAQSGTLDEGSSATEIHPGAGFKPGDSLVVKRRVGAFAGSDLDMALRTRNIDTLWLAGIATSGVVLSTLRQAADLDYAVNVLSDCCFDPDPQVHDVLMNKVFPRQADIRTLADMENAKA